MKSHIKTFSILILLLSTLLYGCSSINNYQKDIYNDDSKIVSEADSYSFTNDIKNMVNNILNIRYGTFYGMETIFTIKSNGKGSITIEFNSKVNKGNFKVVFITPDNRVIKILEQSEKGTKTIGTKNGTSRIKIVGNDAGGQLEISVKPEGDALIKRVDNF